MKLKKIIQKIEEFYPKELAYDWDNVGLLIGDENQEVSNVLTALEITDEVIEEAILKKTQLIVVHHPLIFKSIDNLNQKNPQNKKIIKLIQNNISVYCLHTNIDIAPNGINDWICQILDIQKTQILQVEKKVQIYKVKLETDYQNLNNVLDVLKKIDLVNKNEFIMSPKIKQFKNTKTNQNLEKDVVIIECKATNSQIIILKKYIYQLSKIKKIRVNLEALELAGNTINYGLGRIGEIRPQHLDDLAYKIEKKFKIKGIKTVGNKEQLIKKVAVVGGSGKSLIEVAKNKKCDVLITGDIGFHDAHHALELGINLIDATHYLEIIFNDGMKSFLDLIDGIKVEASTIDTNPFEEI